MGETRRNWHCSPEVKLGGLVELEGLRIHNIFIITINYARKFLFQITEHSQYSKRFGKFKSSILSKNCALHSGKIIAFAPLCNQLWCEVSSISHWNNEEYDIQELNLFAFLFKRSNIPTHWAWVWYWCDFPEYNIIFHGGTWKCSILPQSNCTVLWW